MKKTFLLGVLLSLVSGCALLSTPPRNPQAATINVKLGLTYLQQGNVNLAKAKLNRALEEGPESSMVNWANALLEERLGNLEGADAFYAKAIRLDPKDSEARNNYGAFLCRRGKVEAALAEFDAAVRNPLYETAEYAYFNAGMCAVQHGLPAQAEDYFKKALERNRNYASALYQMALLTYKQERFLPSRAYRQRLEQALETEDPKALWLCVMTERALGDYNEASRCEQRLKSGFPQSEEAASLTP